MRSGGARSQRLDTLRRTGRFAACLMGAVLAITLASSQGSDKGPNPTRAENVFIQVVNPDARTSIRVVLDGRVIYDALPVRSTLNNIPTVPAVAGSFAWVPGSRHELTAEVPGAGPRAQLKWASSLDAGRWIVIHYYPGRGDANVPPFFAFAIQDAPHKYR